MGRAVIQSLCEAALVKSLTLILLLILKSILITADPQGALHAFSIDGKATGPTGFLVQDLDPGFWDLLRECTKSVCTCGKGTEVTHRFTYLCSVVHVKQWNLDFILCLGIFAPLALPTLRYTLIFNLKET